MATKKVFEKPESYTEVKDLDALSNLALDEYSVLVKIADDDLTDEQIDRMVELKQAMKDIKVEQGLRVVAAEERAQKIADAKAADEDDDDESDDDEEVDEDEGDDDETEEEEAEEDETVDADKEAILAAAKRPVAKRRATTRRRKPAEEDEVEGRKVSITAQADVRGYSNGQELDMDGAVQAFMSRLQGMPGGGTKKVGSAINAYGVATFAKTAEPKFADNTITDRMSAEDQWRNVMAAASNKKAGSAAILADGGWCAPSTNFYDLCQWETIGGGLDLPEITVVRGGINFTKGPDFSDIYTNTGFLQTEAQAEAGTAKTFLEVDCPDWTDVRLDAIGYGVKAPILTASPAGFPELVRRYLEGALVAHWHKVNAYVINKVVAALGSVQDFTEYGSASGDLLNAIEIAAQSLRYKYRLGENETLEAMFPVWVKSALRADLARRAGVDLLAVTDSQVQTWFTMRGIRPQYVYDWAGQDLVGTETQFPVAVRFGIWRSGTFVKGTNNIIRLDAIYDSTEITTNNYTAAFFEEAILVANTCGQGRIFEVAMNYHGRTGASDIGASDNS